jgi:hypothetical protein
VEVTLVVKPALCTLLVWAKVLIIFCGLQVLLASVFCTCIICVNDHLEKMTADYDPSREDFTLVGTGRDYLGIFCQRV